MLKRWLKLACTTRLIDFWYFPLCNFTPSLTKNKNLVNTSGIHLGNNFKIISFGQWQGQINRFAVTPLCNFLRPLLLIFCDNIYSKEFSCYQYKLNVTFCFFCYYGYNTVLALEDMVTWFFSFQVLIGVFQNFKLDLREIIDHLLFWCF